MPRGAWWTTGELRRLGELTAMGLPYRACGPLLGRTGRACECAARRFGLALPRDPARRRGWLLRRVRDLFRDSPLPVSAPALSAMLGRHTRSGRACVLRAIRRLARWGLVERCGVAPFHEGPGPAPALWRIRP